MLSMKKIMHKTALILICGLALAVASCSKNEQANTNRPTVAPSTNSANTAEAKNPPPNIVTASAAEVSLPAGGQAVASVQLNIASGYHVNSNPASAKYLIATTLSLEPATGITAGQPQYPPSLTKKFAFSPDPLAVYEGEATIKVPLKAESGAAKGTQSLRAHLRVQPCDDQACYPPRTIDTTIPVVLK